MKLCESRYNTPIACNDEIDRWIEAENRKNPYLVRTRPSSFDIVYVDNDYPRSVKLCNVDRCFFWFASKHPIMTMNFVPASFDPSPFPYFDNYGYSVARRLFLGETDGLTRFDFSSLLRLM